MLDKMSNVLSRFFFIVKKKKYINQITGILFAYKHRSALMAYHIDIVAFQEAHSTLSQLICTRTHGKQ